VTSLIIDTPTDSSTMELLLDEYESTSGVARIEPRYSVRTGAPLVSVVIAAYNAARHIAEALDSVFAQTYANYEVIVVNDGSPDTEQLESALAPYRDRIRYFREKHRGVSGARNVGIHEARGTIYSQLDADDKWEPDYLEYHVSFLANHHDIDLVYPNALIFGNRDGHGMDFMSVSPSEGEPTLEALLTLRCVVMTSVTARIEAVRAVGAYDEELTHCEDFDLWARMAYAGSRLAYHRRQLVHYRRSSTSLSSNHERMVESQLRVMEKMRRDMRLAPAQQQALEDGERQCRMERSLIRARTALRDQRIDDARRHILEVAELRPSFQLRAAYLLLGIVPTFFRPMLAVRRALRKLRPRIRLKLQNESYAS
jgi:GT2 family glycosyltransferase